MSDTFLRLQQVFRETFDDDALVLTDALTSDDVDGWDSLAHVSLIVAVERAFGVRFTSAEVTGLPNAGALRKLVEAKLA